MEIAIVTGASSDQDGLDEIWLVARRRPQLETLAGELTTKSRIYALDLMDRASLLTLQQALAACQVTVRYLIYAAGFGKMGPVAAVPAGVLENMIDLNDRAAVSLYCLIVMPAVIWSRFVPAQPSCPFRNWLSTRRRKPFSCATAGHWPWNWHRWVSSYLPFVRIG